MWSRSISLLCSIILNLVLRCDHKFLYTNIIDCIGSKGSIVVCVSPLTSLMMDQQHKFSPMGLCTEYVCDSQDRTVKARVIKGEVQLVFISPESLISNKAYRRMLLSDIYQQHLVALVVDEAHCIKTWGDEFRTAFSEIGNL